MVDNETFLFELARAVPDDQRLLLSSVPGDPAEAGAEAWNVRPWGWGARMPPVGWNNYVCVSSFTRGPDGWRRRAAEFGRGLAFMIDDLGTKLDARPVLARLMPTALIETSPGNMQAWYFLEDPVADYEKFAALQAAFVARWAAGKDPGMGGPNRVGRLPGGINGKAKYGGAWAHRVLEWHPAQRPTVGVLLGAFDLQLRVTTRVRPSGVVSAADQAERRAEFDALVGMMARQGRFLKRAFGHNGRRPILCPRVHQHTGGATSGSYLSEPNEKNSWWGSFVCYHSSTHNDMCRLRELKDEVLRAEDTRIEAALEAANERG